jgi:hypothetical protein
MVQWNWRVSRSAALSKRSEDDRMDIADHYALKTGSATLANGSLASLTVQILGILRVPSGRLGACDPFVELEQPTVVLVPPGDYPVSVTIADVSEDQDGSHKREAYLSVILSDAEPATVEPAPGPDGPPDEGEFFGVGVDAGTVAFVDADSVAGCMPDDGTNWYEDLYDSGEPDSWFSVMDAAAPLPAGLANIVMPRATAGENVVLAHSGWGDGFYPLLQTRAADGHVTGIHIDLRVVGKFDEEPADPTTAHEPPVPESAPLPQKKSWFARLLGR